MYDCLYIKGWPEPYLCTVYDRIFGDIPAKPYSTVFHCVSFMFAGQQRAEGGSSMHDCPYTLSSPSFAINLISFNGCNPGLILFHCVCFMFAGQQRVEGGQHAAAPDEFTLASSDMDDDVPEVGRWCGGLVVVWVGVVGWWRCGSVVLWAGGVVGWWCCGSVVLCVGGVVGRWCGGSVVLWVGGVVGW